MESKVKGKKRILRVGERAGPSTPSTAWSHSQFSSQNNKTWVSARKLCAHLWQLQPPHYPVPRISCQKTKSSNLRRRVAASVMQQRGPVERHDHGFPKPEAPSSYGSSPEVAVPYKYNPAITPSSSLGFKGRVEGSSGYKVKSTAMDLLKVLNRIWDLEEQHASNVSLVKALKTELDRSRARIQEFLLSKNKEQGRINGVIHSLRDELEEEGKLRKNSESSCRKLARELSVVTSCFADALKELKSERKARILLENLCDEFARGVQCLKQNHVADHGEGPERLILHISEAWLDERMQMKPTGRNTIIDKLSLDIHTFLEAKRDTGSRKCERKKNGSLRRHSLKPFPLIEAVNSVLHGAAGEEDSSGSDKQCNELNRSVKVRPRGASKGSKLIRSAYHGGSSVQRRVSKSKSGDFETSNSSLKLGKESTEGKVTKSKTRRPAIV